MSGTSLDGIDVAIVDIHEDDNGLYVTPVYFETTSMADATRQAVLRLFRPETSSTEDVCDMNFLLGHLFADAVLNTVEHAGLEIEQIEMISSHGQTVFHNPTPKFVCGRSVTSTLQIGESAVIAERTGRVVISDFRVRDMAAGGQGAPLVPYVDRLLFSSDRYGRIAANFGGIANLTVLPKKGTDQPVLAFDSGPGNMIIDGLVRHYTGGTMTYDEEGRIARSGRTVAVLLDKWMNHPFMHREPPKSTGREEFGEQCVTQWLRDGHELAVTPGDLIATATEYTIRSFAESVRKFVLPVCAVEEVLVGGGGANNPVIMEGIRRELWDLRVNPQEVTGISADSKEAVAFAVLGYECFHRRPNNVPTATGARHPVVMGKITWP